MMTILVTRFQVSLIIQSVMARIMEQIGGNGGWNEGSVRQMWHQAEYTR